MSFRIAFTRDLLQRSPLVGKIDPSDILILQEEIGTVASETQGATCAMVQVKITTSSGKVICMHVLGISKTHALDLKLKLTLNNTVGLEIHDIVHVMQNRAQVKSHSQ